MKRSRTTTKIPWVSEIPRSRQPTTDAGVEAGPRRAGGEQPPQPLAATARVVGERVTSGTQGYDKEDSGSNTYDEEHSFEVSHAPSELSPRNCTNIEKSVDVAV